MLLDLANLHRELNLKVRGIVHVRGQQFLQGVDYIYSEVNRDELYPGCTTLEPFEMLLRDQGFTRVELVMHEHLGWGNAFYVRRYTRSQ